MPYSDAESDAEHDAVPDSKRKRRNGFFPTGVSTEISPQSQEVINFLYRSELFRSNLPDHEDRLDFVKTILFNLLSSKNILSVDIIKNKYKFVFANIEEAVFKATIRLFLKKLKEDVSFCFVLENNKRNGFISMCFNFSVPPMFELMRYHFVNFLAEKLLNGFLQLGLQDQNIIIEYSGRPDRPFKITLEKVTFRLLLIMAKEKFSEDDGNQNHEAASTGVSVSPAP